MRAADGYSGSDVVPGAAVAQTACGQRRGRARRRPGGRIETPRSRRVKALLLGGVVALATKPEVRNRLLDALFGPEEQFDYESLTEPLAPPLSADPPAFAATEAARRRGIRRLARRGLLVSRRRGSAGSRRGARRGAARAAVGARGADVADQRCGRAGASRRRRRGAGTPDARRPERPAAESSEAGAGVWRPRRSQDAGGSSRARSGGGSGRRLPSARREAPTRRPGGGARTRSAAAR